jgi:hypothetical protein
MSLFDQVTYPRARGQIGAAGCLRGNQPSSGLSQALGKGQETLGSHQDCSHLNVSAAFECQGKTIANVVHETRREFANHLVLHRILTFSD